MPAFDTIMPAAVETMRAGTCVTRPSPMVSRVKVCDAAAKDMPCWATPMMMPPMMLMPTIKSPAIASPRTNFEAPSIAPKKLDSDSSVFRLSRASVSLIRPAERSASTAICLPGMASKVKRAATSAMRPAPFVMTMKFTMMRIANTMMPMTKLPWVMKVVRRLQ